MELDKMLKLNFGKRRYVMIVKHKKTLLLKGSSITIAIALKYCLMPIGHWSLEVRNGLQLEARKIERKYCLKFITQKNSMKFGSVYMAQTPTILYLQIDDKKSVEGILTYPFFFCQQNISNNGGNRL